MSIAIDVSSPHNQNQFDGAFFVSPVHKFDCQTNDDATKIQNAQNANNTKQNQLTIDQNPPQESSS